MKKVISYKLSAISFLMIVLVLCGCGFHLRGAVALHIQKVHIQSESADQIANEVKRILTEEGVQVTPTTKAAQAVVYLRHENVDERVLSVSDESGKQEEIEINYRVEMEVRKPDDSILLEKQIISLFRDYRFDKTAVLAAGGEEEMLREDMFHDIVAQIIRRLQAIKPR
jgi:LPS-assembly lipoprotein